MFVTLIDSCFFHVVTLISIKFASVPSTSGGNFREENWSERFLLKVYIVCYFSLIIFYTVELTSFATRAVLGINYIIHTYVCI